MHERSGYVPRTTGVSSVRLLRADKCLEERRQGLLQSTGRQPYPTLIQVSLGKAV